MLLKSCSRHGFQNQDYSPHFLGLLPGALSVTLGLGLASLGIDRPAGLSSRKVSETGKGNTLFSSPLVRYTLFNQVPWRKL